MENALSLTTDRDLHYCEETQLAASTLVCSTHNTQLFTFSRLYLLTWSSSIWSRPWVHVMQTHWLTAHWLPYHPFINWVCVKHKSSHIITLTLCNRSFTRWSRNSISISDLLLLSLHSKFPLEARSSKTSLIPSTGSLLFICPLLNNSKSWADARSIVVTELTYDKIKISNLKNKNM